MIVCKKWHVAKRLTDFLLQHFSINSLGYLFDEMNPELDDLGGLANSQEKLARHRRSAVRLYFEHYGEDQLLTCIDPSQFEVIEDFASDSVKLKILEVECDFDDQYLLGHAMRVDLLAEGTEMKDASTLIGTIRNDLNAESERLKDREFDLFWTYKQTTSDKENAQALMEFCGIEQSVADEIISQKWIFED